MQTDNKSFPSDDLETEITLAKPFERSGKIIVSNNEYVATLRYLKAEEKKVDQVKVVKNSGYVISYYSSGEIQTDLI